MGEEEGEGEEGDEGEGGARYKKAQDGKLSESEGSPHTRKRKGV